MSGKKVIKRLRTKRNPNRKYSGPDNAATPFQESIPSKKVCYITAEGSEVRRLVSAASLYTADKDNLSDRDLASLIKDRNGAIWRVPGTQKSVRCTIFEIHDMETSSSKPSDYTTPQVKKVTQPSARLFPRLKEDARELTPEKASPAVDDQDDVVSDEETGVSAKPKGKFETALKGSSEKGKHALWGFSQQAQPWTKESLDAYENMETQMPPGMHGTPACTSEAEETATPASASNVEKTADSDNVMSVVELVKDTHRIVQKLDGKEEKDREIFMIEEVDILAIPAKDPVKFCLQAMDVLFSREEMSKGRYKAVRQRGDRTPNPPLDPLKVRIIDDAIIKRFGIELFNETAPKVRRQANQKCSDIYSKQRNKTE
eukprot:Em0007g172a